MTAAVLLAFALAGCADASDAPSTESPSPTVRVVATRSLLPEPEPTTDAMYLLAPPHMTASPPDGETFRTLLPSYVEGSLPAPLGTSERIEWQLPRGGLRVLDGNLTFWAEIRGAVTNPNIPFNGTACFWSVTILAYADDGGFHAYGNCLDEPAVIPEGIREMRWDFSGLDMSGVTGDILAVSIASSGIYGDGSSVEILWGSREHPSRLAVRGLALPLDTETYV